MKPSSHRKMTRFYIINPIGDRRLECRFESKESVQISSENAPNWVSGIATDIGKNGFKLASSSFFEVGQNIQASFNESKESIRCFGYIVWSRKSELGAGFESGVCIESWHGIVSGEDAWKTYKGTKPLRERRRKISLKIAALNSNLQWA